MLPNTKPTPVGLDVNHFGGRFKEIVGMKDFYAQTLFFLKGRGNLEEASAKAQFRHTSGNFIRAAWQNDLGIRLEGKA